MALVNRLTVRVDSRGWRTLRLRLRDEYVCIKNTLEKKKIIQHWQNHDDLVEFMANLSRPNSRGWMYRGVAPWRWGSGGYIAIFTIAGVRYVLMFLRKYPFPSGWNLPLGGARTCAELEQPHLVADREFKEETIAFNRRSNTLLLLDRHGLRQNPMTGQRAVFRSLHLPFPRHRKLVMGRLLPNQPDEAHVGGFCEPRRTPYISEPGLVIFNPADIGIEFLQAIEFTIDSPLSDLRFFDGELHEDCDLGVGISPGSPILQAVGMFRFDDLVHEFSMRRPQPHPEVIFDNGWPLRGKEEIRSFMEREQGATEWCPATVNGLLRFFDTIHDIRNQFTQLSDRRWRLRFRGEEGYLPDRLPFAYLNHLLHLPRGTAVACEQLHAMCAADVVATNESETGMSEADLKQAGLFIQSSGGGRSKPSRANDEALYRLADELNDLKTERLDAVRANDLEELARLEQQIERITEQLTQLARQHVKGVDPSSGSLAERIKWAVSKDFHRGIAQIRDVLPACGEHLAKSISCGKTCAYMPASEMNWL